MNTFLGIALDTWATIDADCPIAHEVSKTEAQLELGHSTGSLHLLLTEDALVNLMAAAGEALDEMRRVNLCP
jgi:hypothetical protein